TPLPFREDDLWNGYPEETNAPYGLAKKMLLVQSQAYRQEYGYDSVFLLLVNLYGPRDNFDPESSHVIPALIKKCVDAKTAGRGAGGCARGGGGGAAPGCSLWGGGGGGALVRAGGGLPGRGRVTRGGAFELWFRDLGEIRARHPGLGGGMGGDGRQPTGPPRR